MTISTEYITAKYKVSDIAHLIASDWKNISPYALDYLNAMKEINDIEGSYFADSCKSVVMYFLANAGTYRGENARASKAILKEMIK